jgi:hypothetical protein
MKTPSQACPEGCTAKMGPAATSLGRLTFSASGGADMVGGAFRETQTFSRTDATSIKRIIAARILRFRTREVGRGGSSPRNSSNPGRSV